MINTIFYFADTELEYLDNYSRHQVKPYTIVFCKDTKSLWKNGIRYGSSTQAEMDTAINDIITRDVTPLINALNTALDDANTVADNRYYELNTSLVDFQTRLQDANSVADQRYTSLGNSLSSLQTSLTSVQNTVNDERTRLTNTINGLDSSIANKVEDMLEDSEWIQSNWPQGVTSYQEGWNDNVQAYLKTVGLWDYDDNGATTTKWSQVRQSINGINSTVNQITKPGDGSLATLQSAINQEITDRGTAITNIENTYTAKQSDNEDILKWLYSGLKTGTNPDKSFSELVAAAKNGDTSAISNINTLVEEIKDNNGNPTGKYRAKASLTSAVDSALSGILTDTSNQYANATMISSLNGQIASLNTSVSDLGTQVQGIANSGNMTGSFVAQADYDTAIAGLRAADTKNGNAIGEIQTKVNNLEGGPEVTNSIAAKVNSAISTFEQNVNAGTACTTLVNKVNTDSDNLSALVSKITNDSSSMSLATKINNMAAGVISQSDLNSAVAALQAADTKNGNAIGEIQTKINTLDGGPQVTNSIAAKVNSAISTFEQNVNAGTACTTLANKVDTNADDIAALTVKIDGDGTQIGLAGRFNNFESGLVGTIDNRIAQSALVSNDTFNNYKSTVYTKTETDGKISNATAGLVAANDFTSASIVAKVNEAGSEVKISADKLKIDATTTEFNTAVGQLVQALALEQIDIEGNVQAILEGGNGTFNGKVNASELQAGDDTDLHIVTTENQLLFKNGDKVVGRFVVDGSGLQLFVLNSQGLEYKIDWDNWSRTSTVAFDQEIFYELNQGYSNNEYIASWTPRTYYKYNEQYYRDSNNDESYLVNISLSDNLNKRYKMTTRYLLYPVPLRYENENTGHSVIVPVRVLEFRQVYFDDGDIGYTNNYIYATNFIPEYVGVCCNGNESFTQGDITIYPINVEYYPQTKCRWVSKLNSSNYDYYLEVADPDLDEEYAAISNDRINVVNPISIGGQMTLYTSPISTQDLPDMSNNYLYSNNGHNR